MIFSAFLVFLVALVYFSSAQGQFVFDDIGGICNQVAVKRGNVRVAWNTRRRLTFASYALQAKYARTDPDTNQPITLPFHIVNMMLHAGCAVLWFAICQKLFAPYPALHPGAYLAAIVFAIHPLTVNAVANISGRPSPLSVLFMLASLLATLHGHWWLVLVFYPLAVLSKEDAAVLPVTLAAVLLSLGMPMGLLFLILPVAAAIRFSGYVKYLYRFNYSRELIKCGLPDQNTRASHALTFFVESLIRFPQWFAGTGFNPDPDISPARVKSRRFAGAVAILCIVAGAAIWLNHPLVWVALSLIVISPWSPYVLIPLPDVIFEHRAYFSMTGLSLLWALIFTALPASWTVSIGACAALAWFAIQTAYRGAHWTSSISLWSMALCDGSNRKVRVLVNLGDAHMSIPGAEGSATQYFQEALKINPRLVTAWANMGIVATRLKEHGAALHCFKQAVKHGPNYGFAWFVLAEQYNRMNRPARAEVCYRKAVALREDMDMAWHKLGLLQSARQSMDAAKISFQKAAELKPWDHIYQLNYGMVSEVTGDHDQAMRCFEKVPASLLMQNVQVNLQPRVAG